MVSVTAPVQSVAALPAYARLFGADAVEGARVRVGAGWIELAESGAPAVTIRVALLAAVRRCCEDAGVPVPVLPEAAWRSG